MNILPSACHRAGVRCVMTGSAAKRLLISRHRQSGEVRVGAFARRGADALKQTPA